MRRRLAGAARALLQTEDRILDIALDYQFNSHETFTRAFKRVFDQQPSQWRKQGRLDRWQLMPRLTLAHLQHLHKGAYLKPVLQQRQAIPLAGLMTLVWPGMGPGAANAVADLWSLAARELAGLEGKQSVGDYYGLACYQEGWEEGGFLYLAGVEVEALAGADLSSDTSGSHFSVARTALAVKPLPALAYARFVHKGLRRDLRGSSESESDRASARRAQPSLTLGHERRGGTTRSCDLAGISGGIRRIR